ncbi:hypothetical protein V8C44DRAFT_327377 [Trichoderma aethiopicum]
MFRKSFHRHSSGPEPSLTTAICSISAIPPSGHDTKDALDTARGVAPLSLGISGAVYDTVRPAIHPRRTRLLAQACQTNAILYDELHAISPRQLPLPQSARDKATRANLAAIRIPPPQTTGHRHTFVQILDAVMLGSVAFLESRCPLWKRIGRDAEVRCQACTPNTTSSRPHMGGTKSPAKD